MGINRESEVGANLQVGPTSLGMVRLYIEADGIDLPLDFEPEEAEEIAEELRAAAARAREMRQGGRGEGRRDGGGAGGGRPGQPRGGRRR
jgi:hypothetical protein